MYLTKIWCFAPILIALSGVNATNPRKLIVTLKGEAKVNQWSRAGIYVLGPDLLNGKSHWLQESGSNSIWYNDKNGYWHIGTQNDLGRGFAGIYSNNDVAGPQVATTWHYNDNNKWFTSNDILVDTFVEPGYCEHNADIIFVLDSSGSESGFWTQIKEWVKKTVNGLHNIGLRSEIGLVAFDDHADKSHEIQLTAHEDRARFLRDVDNLPFLGGGTRIDLGMKEALEMFKARRTNAHATVVLLTDGQGSDVPLRTVGNWFHAEKIRVIVVGIGSGVNRNDLKSMCKNNGQGSETHDHYFDAANIDELVSARFIENSIEGCNFATDCHSKETKLLGGIIGEGIPNIAGFKECARECQKQHNQVTREGRPQAACHYFTYYDASFVRPSRRSNNWPKDCELHSQDHCGFYGSHCQQKEVVGVESGSLTSCEGKNFI